MQESNPGGAAPGSVVDTSRLYPARPMLGVGAVVLREAEVLLIRRGKPPRKGQWSLPGGLQELGERAEEAAVREVMEETGIEIAVEGLVDVIDIIQRDDDGRVRVHYTLLDYLARPLGGRLQAGSDAADAVWMPLPRLGEIGLWDETRRVIRAADTLRGRLRP